MGQRVSFCLALFLPRNIMIYFPKNGYPGNRFFIVVSSKAPFPTTNSTSTARNGLEYKALDLLE
jgi:hypothetical protein